MANGPSGYNIALCAAISNYGVLHNHATVGPYNTQHLLTLLTDLLDGVLGREQQDHEQAGESNPSQRVVQYQPGIYHCLPFHLNALSRTPKKSPSLNGVGGFMTHNSATGKI